LKNLINFLRLVFQPDFRYITGLLSPHGHREQD
jgi:hypothetical protein